MNINDVVKIENKQPMTIKALAEEMKTAAHDLAKSQKAGCYHWNIGKIGNNDFAICLGWNDGYENEPNDPFAAKDIDAFGEGCHLEAKLGYQPDNSIMQCDYDIDWLMPYSPDGDVDDMSESIYTDTDFEQLALLYIERFAEYADENGTDAFTKSIRNHLLQN